ncbi:MAG: MFS transporter [Gammaproteobacteria bacterium]|nr:MFS transporter [Gammaproteobacteria bacterium]MDH5302965.1 MFS transporter [Gammaproteobacteria bacterium]
MKLSITEKLGFGAGDMAVNIVMITMQLIIAYFYTDIYGLDPTDMGILFIVVRLIDAISDPVMGMITDKCNSKHGHYRPFMLWFAIPFGVAVYLAFITPDLAYSYKLAWAYFSYILLTLLFTVVTIPYISLIGVITDDPVERLSANGYRFVLVKVAAFLVTIVVPALALYLGDGNIRDGYQPAMGLMGILGSILFLVCFFTTKERIKPVIEKTKLKEQARLLFANDQWLLLCVVLVLLMCGIVIRGSVGAYYAKYYLNGGDILISPFLATGVTASILAMIASTWITKFYCKIKLFRYSQILTFVLCIAMYFTVGQDDIALAFVFTFLIWFFADQYMPIFWSSIAEAVDYGHRKTGTRVSGLAFGGISFCQKLGMGVAGGLLGYLLSYFNYQADVEQSEFTLNGIALLATVIPAIFHLAVGLIMRKYFISNEYYDEISSDLKLANRQ